MEYERSLKEERDMYSALLTAEERGRKERDIAIALNAIKEGFSNETIHELTGLSVEEIDRLRK